MINWSIRFEKGPDSTDTKVNAIGLILLIIKTEILGFAAANDGTELLIHG